MFLDAKGGRIVVRSRAGGGECPKMPPSAFPLIPVFSDFVIRKPSNITELRFYPVDPTESNVPLYMLDSLQGLPGHNGRSKFRFGFLANPTVEGSSLMLPGRYRFATRARMRINIDKSVSLLLLNVDPGASGRQYELFINQNTFGMDIVRTSLIITNGVFCGRFSEYSGEELDIQYS